MTPKRMGVSASRLQFTILRPMLVKGKNMNPFRLLVMSISCSVFLSACNTRESQNTQQITLSNIKFLVPANLTVSNAEELENGAVFEIEGIWGELRNNQLVVMGKSYGEVNAGDEVLFKPDGTFLVNGSPSESTGLADSAVMKNGVLYFFPGRAIKESTNDGGTHFVELPGGATYELTNSGIIIEGHEYGPFSSKTVVKIDPDGSVAFNP